MLLKNKGDFLMHGVVLQNRVFRPPRMFHVKHSCVKEAVLPSDGGPMFHVKPFSPAPLTKNPARDVSRETSLRKTRAPSVDDGRRVIHHRPRTGWVFRCRNIPKLASSAPASAGCRWPKR